MKVYIRADASVEIGMGHVMRCLTLANELRGKGAEVSFICRELTGNLVDYVENKGFKVFRLPYAESQLDNTLRYPQHIQWLGADWWTDAEQTAKILANEKDVVDWIVVDHYALDEQWEREVKPYVKKIMVIDDLADRPHVCHLLLDQNLYEDMEHRYDQLVPDYCVKLLGPRYALLRPEFREARKNLRERDGTVRRILIFFGGSDPTNQTGKALEAIRLLNKPEIVVDVIAGSSNPNKKKLEETCAGMPNVNYYCQVDNMAQLMANADLAIGAGGATTWERCCLGLNSIIISIAENQRAIADEIGKNKLGVYLGGSKEITSDLIRGVIERVVLHPGDNIIIGKRATILVDGKGLPRVADILLGS